MKISINLVKMKSLLFTDTGYKQSLTKEITLFTNYQQKIPPNCEQIIMPDINYKHCVIMREDDRYKIMDLCSLDTKLLLKDEKHPFPLKPFKFYDLRNGDKILIGKRQVIICNDDGPVENVPKTSFIIPETQDVLSQILPDTHSTMIQDSHVEIPETQGFDTPQIETPKIEAPVQRLGLDTQLNVDTQPLLNIVPRLTRAQQVKQTTIKPKTIPVSIFDCDTQAFSVDTEPFDIDIKREPLRPKRKAEMSSASLQRMNSILMSDNDSDDERSNKSVVIKSTHVVRNSLENDNSMNISINDEYEIPSQAIDSQFLDCVNESCDNENLSYVLNADIKREVKAEPKDVKKEKVSIRDKFNNSNDSEDENKTRKKKIKLFRFDYSDDDE